MIFVGFIQTFNPTSISRPSKTFYPKVSTGSGSGSGSNMFIISVFTAHTHDEFNELRNPVKEPV